MSLDLPNVFVTPDTSTLPAVPLELGRLIAEFRRALERRGLEDPVIYRGVLGDALTCTRCFREGASAIGFELEPQQPLPAEEPFFPTYERLSWNTDSDDPDEDVELYAPTHFGLLRLDRGGSDVIWLVSCEPTLGHGSYHQVLLSTTRRSLLREVLEASHRAHESHERRHKLVLIDGRGANKWVEPGDRGWDDLILPAGLREQVRETVEGFFEARELYRSHELAHRRGILLAGPPGNGKTSIIKVVAAQLDHPVVVASLDDVYPPGVRAAFEKAQELSPSVLCFEDLDALIDDSGRRLSQFLNLLDGVVPLDGVLVIATTNRPDRIDPAIARRPSRFDRVFLIPQPKLDQRRAFLERLLGDDAPDKSAADLAERTDGFSMAFLKELVVQARLSAVRRGGEQIREEDLEAALENTSEHLRLADRGLENRGEVGF